MIFPIEAEEIHAPYSDAVRKSFATYSLEEILVEKLCAIIGRTEPRDIYDVNYLFGVDGIDFHSISVAFGEKAEFKGIDPKRLKGSLNDKKDKYERMWKTRMGHQIKELPYLAEVLRELNRNLRKYDL
ncbi:MAG: nucleotidyl transferase AbiEii/AbiGii toxin family protein [Thermoleophilia bacterium]